jgi:hypothetical protein
MAMSKKVRYAIGALGALPALGLLAQGPAAAATHTPKKTAKTVSLHHGPTVAGVGCVGQYSHLAKSSYSEVILQLWTKPNGGRECVGTIHAFVSGLVNHGPVEVWVARPGHNYCEKTASSSVTEACHTSFTPPFTVFARSSAGGTASWRDA